MRRGVRWSVAVSMLGTLGLIPQCMEVDPASDGEAGASQAGGEAGEPAAHVAGSPALPEGGSPGVEAMAGAGGHEVPSQAGAGSPNASGGGAAGEAPGSAGAANGEAGSGGNAGAAATGPLCEPPGEYCKQTYDCPWYHKCSEEHCVPVAEGEACVQPEDCGKAQYCDDSSGQCKNLTVVDFDCTPDLTICAPGSECHWAGLHLGADPNGMYCFSLEKNAGFCDYGIIPCASDYYCPTFVDVETSMPPVCEKRGGLGEGCIDEEPDSCLAGLSCNFYKCQPAAAPDGTRCEAEVQFWKLPYWRDYDDTAEQPCAAGSYCKGLSYNQNSQLEGICTPLKQIGEACEMNWECAASYCDGVKCTAPTPGSRCGNPDVCPSGTVCNAFGRSAQANWFPAPKCVKALPIGEACGEGIEGLCQRGSICDAQYQQRGVCREVVELGEGCADSTCAPGSICIEDP